MIRPKYCLLGSHEGWWIINTALGLSWKCWGFSFYKISQSSSVPTVASDVINSWLIILVASLLILPKHGHHLHIFVSCSTHNALLLARNSFTPELQGCLLWEASPPCISLSSRASSQAFHALLFISTLPHCVTINCDYICFPTVTRSLIHSKVDPVWDLELNKPGFKF